MIKLENTEVTGWEHAIRGMRNPKNSWEKSDSGYCGKYMYCSKCPAYYENEYDFCSLDDYSGAKDYVRDDPRPYVIGPNDHKLMMNLAAAGSTHAKYRRMIVVYVDITAPLYWWKEYDTYKVGTVANSCSTMHKIHAKEFTLEDFSCEHLRVAARKNLEQTIAALNSEREAFIGKAIPELKGDKQCWYSMIQLLPTSYNQKRTCMLNYEVLAGIYPMRKDHKLDEWHTFCHWIEELPYSELIIGEASTNI